LLLLALLSGPALANGTGDDRVTLPDGAGSVGGSGRASVDTSTGALTAAFPIDVPQGHAGLTPALSFAYTSNAGASVLGIGWSLAQSSIERLTNRGLPAYTDADRMALDGAELVQIAGGEPAEYRARFEGAFSRVRWFERGTGDDGYFTVETGDGLVAFYGASKDGVIDQNALERGPDGVFRYLLVDVVDPFGRHMHHTWTVQGTKPLLSQIGWLFANNAPQHQLQFVYEARPDLISDARGGYNNVLAHRLRTVKVLSGTTVVRRYELTFEDEETAWGRSRLQRIQQFGKDGGLLNTTPTFGYARALDGTGACDVDGRCSPQLLELGNTGVNLQARQATLIDLNGDAIPDLLESRDGQAHRIRLGFRGENGQSFGAATVSALSASVDFALNSPFVQPLDVDGDGDVDLLNSQAATFLVNDGSGDWRAQQFLNADAELPLGEDFGLDNSNELAHARFVDIDLDRQIDLLRSDATNTQLFKNVGGGRFVSVPVDAIGAGFLSDNLEMADFNGDGLLDVYILTANTLRIRLNLGNGNWGAFTTIDDVPVSFDELRFTHLEDIDNDGCDDIVVVSGHEVKIARNRGGVRFDDVELIDAIDGVQLPTLEATTSLLFADMNGNGSNDVVWFSENGDVTVLDVTPVPAHLLSSIETATGAVREVTWGTAAEHRRRDNNIGWDLPLPMASLVVDRFEDYALASSTALEAHIVVDHHYTRGFYDADEKAFRGFAEVTATEAAAEGSAGGITTSFYDVGDDGRPAFAGRLLRQTRTTLQGVPIQEQATTWDLCDVADVDNAALDVDVVFVCPTEQRTIEQEGADDSTWVTTRQRSVYDGYGRVLEQHDDGIIAVGDGGCAPCVDVDLPGTGGACGATCRGDEYVERRTWLSPDDNVQGRWLLQLVQEASSDDDNGGRSTRTRSFYDGNAFVGLAAGLASKGVLTREVSDVGDGTTVEQLRVRTDENGNVVEELTPLASIDDDNSDRTLTEWDDAGLHIVKETEFVSRGLGDGEGVRTLVREYTWEPLFELQESSSLPGFLDDDLAGVTLSRYDEHGRLSAVVGPGETLAAPGVVHRYELGAPYSKIATFVRSDKNADADIESIVCVDGMGRTVQTRQRRDDAHFTVSGYSVFNARGDAIATYDAFVADSGDCDDAVDATLPHASSRYDALHRSVETTTKTGKTVRQVFRPAAIESFNEDDLDSSAPGFNTPSLTQLDGRGRVVQLQTRPTASSPLETFRFRYDDSGNLAVTIDPEGNARVQERDLLNRVTSTTDATFGTTTYAYDAASNPIREVHADGTTVVRTFDDLGRVFREAVQGDEDHTLVETFYDAHPSCPTAAGGCTFQRNRLAGVRSHTEVGVVDDVLSYDERGNLLRAVRTIEGLPLVQENTWDNADRLVSTTMPDGRVVNTTINRRGEIEALPGYVEAIEHDAEARLVGYRAQNGPASAFTYDDDDRLATMRTTMGAAAVLDLQFSRDVRGRLTQIDDRVGTGRFSLSKQMTYDGHGRLSHLEYGTGADAEVVQFAYDAIHRTTSRTSSLDAASAEHLGAMTYTADAPQALSGTERARYNYDVRGRLLNRVANNDVDNTAANAADNDLTLQWDGLSRLRRAERADGATTTWAWAGNRLRLYRHNTTAETWWFGDAFQLVDGVGRLQVKVGSDVVVEEDSTALTARFIGDEDNDGVITAADAKAKSGEAQRRALRAAARTLLLGDSGVARRFPVSDHVGSVVAVVDDAGAVAERFATTATGAVRASSAVLTESARVAGGELDATGLVDLGARFYAPHEGRFINPDPTFAVLDDATLKKFPDSLSAYSYAGNDPVSSIDVDGRYPYRKIATAVAVTLVVAGVVGAGMATGALPAFVAGTMAAMATAATAAAIVGAVVGGITAGGAAIFEERIRLKDIRNNNNGQVAASDYAIAAVNVVVSTLAGTIGGFVTEGVSAVFSLASVPVTLAEHHGFLGPKQALAAHLLLDIISIASFSKFRSFGVVSAVLDTMPTMLSFALNGGRGDRQGGGEKKRFIKPTLRHQRGYRNVTAKRAQAPNVTRQNGSRNLVHAK
jgi:RHS repeat-associated protein